MQYVQRCITHGVLQLEKEELYVCFFFVIPPDSCQNFFFRYSEPRKQAKLTSAMHHNQISTFFLHRKIILTE